MILVIYRTTFGILDHSSSKVNSQSSLNNVLVMKDFGKDLDFNVVVNHSTLEIHLLHIFY